MERLEEISARKVELRELLEDETKEVNLEEVKSEIDSLEAEEKEINESLEAEACKDEKEKEERKKIAKSIEERKLDVKEIKEEKTMEEKKFDISSKEYRSAWAKSLMGCSNDKFTEEEKRALGDAVTTTATTYVEATNDAHGINNGGLLIPTSVREDILNIISKSSPFFRDIRKLQVNGNIDLPFLGGSDDAQWGTENVDSNNEGIEFKKITLTGHELYKDVVVTWKVEEMAVESFISFIIEEIADKMGKAICEAVINGNGSGKPTGALNGLDAITTGNNALEVILNTYGSLSAEAKVGAKVYIAPDVAISLYGQAGNGNYPFLQGLKSTALFDIETDPFVPEHTILAGNAQNYVFNENTPIRVDRERTIKGRKSIYGGYAIVDGNAKAGSFAKGTYTVASV